MGSLLWYPYPCTRFDLGVDEMITKACKECDEDFSVPETSAGWNTKYCGRDCAHEVKRRRRNTRNRERTAAGIRRKRTNLSYKQYGITTEQYEEMLASQDSRCRICGVHQEELTRRLAVDHSHKDGHIRGLLCIKCNAGLGNLGDSISLVRKALDYLEETGE